MIDRFRSEFNKLSSNEDMKTIYDHSFKKPCQIHIINSPDDNSHLLLTTHLESIRDKKINHYSLKSKLFPEQLEKIVHNTKWIIHNNVTFKREIERIFLDFGQHILDNQNISKSEIFPITFDSRNKFSALMIMGNMLEINYDEYFITQIKQYKNYQKPINRQNIEPSKTIIPVMNTGLAAVFDPPISIGIFDLTLSQKIRSQEFNILNENAVVKKFHNNVITITKGGKIWIDNNDKKTVKKIFNIMMAIALLFDISTQTIRSSDLAEITFNAKTRNISTYTWSNLGKIDKYLNRYYRVAITRVYRKNISVDLMSKIIQITESIITNYEYTEYLRLILNAHTQLNNEDNSQSFIISWTIIENDLYKKWTKKIHSSKIDKIVKKKLEGLSVDRILDILYLEKIISCDYYLHLKSLQKLRNKIIHKGMDISNKETKICYDSAWNIIDDIVKDIVNLSNIHA